MAREYVQGHKARQVSFPRYVRLAAFQAGYIARCANLPPPAFNTDWTYEHGRQLASGLMARGVDPLRLPLAEQVKWLKAMLGDGTIVR